MDAKIYKTRHGKWIAYDREGKILVMCGNKRIAEEVMRDYLEYLRVSSDEIFGWNWEIMGDYGKECDADSTNQTNQRLFGVLAKSAEWFARRNFWGSSKLNSKNLKKDAETAWQPL